MPYSEFENVILTDKRNDEKYINQKQKNNKVIVRDYEPCSFECLNDPLDLSEGDRTVIVMPDALMKPNS